MPDAGLFLYGQPETARPASPNGSFNALSPHIWIPRTVTVGGETIRLFDPASHVEAPLEPPTTQLLDTLR